ncbi:MAG: hypothetical protein ACK4SJ_11225 [Sphingorhabdus sp.]
MKPFVIYAVAPAIGPVMVNVLGYDVPVLSAGLSVLGVVLASIIAPPPALTVIQRFALTTLLVLLMLALVISDPARSPIMSTCWAIGIGYTGLPIIKAISDRIVGRSGELTGDSLSADPASEDIKR